MTGLFSEKYRKLLLLISNKLTEQEKDEFRFYCKGLVPQSVLEKHNILETFIHLEWNESIGSHNLQFLIGFLRVERRQDLVRAIKEYEVEVGLLDVLLLHLLQKTDTRLTNIDYSDESVAVARWLNSSGEGNQLGNSMQEIANAYHSHQRQLSQAIKEYAKEIDISVPLNSLSWPKVLRLVGFAAEVIAVRARRQAGNNNGDMASERDVKEALEVLECIAPWVADNGGMVKLAFHAQSTNIRSEDRGCLEEAAVRREHLMWVLLLANLMSNFANVIILLGIFLQ